MSIIKCLEKINHDSVVDRCCDSGVKLAMGDLKNYVILKGEKACDGNMICDCVIFLEKDNIIICLIELKNKNMHASDIETKISNSAKLALELLEDCKKTSLKIEIYPILLYKNINHTEFPKIKQIKIVIRDKCFSIIAQKCQYPLCEILSKYKKYNTK